MRILLGSGGVGLNSASNGKFEIWSFRSASGSTAFFSLDTSGKTTLTNKFWQSSQPLNTITTPNAASGEALVVEGNTRLRGKVIIEKAQGDIAMGAYGTP